MWIGFAEFDYLLGDVHSLKHKRSVIRPIIAETRKRFSVSVAEVAHLDAHRRAVIGVGVVAADRGHVVDVLDAVERFAAGRPEVELLSVRTRIISASDV
ncbi:DUF503 domain-containing protein [Gordonia sp. CPCC 206044]|uniref:DUF503 domain-containing protein n=1 Tax=Gordonia sp. CPCC 206044 TaxID=3140793 RepID=UPI003AF3524B